MDFKIQITADGSQTVFSERFQEGYHSVHGAVTESMHVFINAGLHACERETINVFEVGFGTGLNTLLTFIETEKRKIRVNYQSIELYPLQRSVLDLLNYPEFTTSNVEVFKALHNVPWDIIAEISPDFHLKKIRANLLEYIPEHGIDLVYFDAFSPAHQPELWSDEVFARFYANMKSGGVLVTYCAKGVVRRNMEKAGFVTERLPGPPGKREMLRAKKL